MSGSCGAPAGSGAGRAAVISVERYSGQTTAAERAERRQLSVRPRWLCPAEGCCVPCAWLYAVLSLPQQHAFLLLSGDASERCAILLLVGLGIKRSLCVLPSPG